MSKKLEAKNVNVFYDQTHVIKNVSLDIDANSVAAFIGPSGCLLYTSKIGRAHV